MWTRSVLLVMVLVLGLCRTASGQFVTLEGRKFMLNGQEFFPRVMNFPIILVHPDAQLTSTNINLLHASSAPHHGRSVTSCIECENEAQCDTQLAEHFDKLVAMGFNAIRFGLGPYTREDGGNRYTLKITTPDHVHCWQNTGFTVDLEPGFTGTFSDRYFQVLREVIALADLHGLKTILLCSEDDMANFPDVQLVPTEDLPASELYADYLSRLGEELHDQEGLLAYDLWNEPTWTTQVDYSMSDLSKASICEHTTRWYDALQEPYDGNHLVTLGGSAHDEIGSWDPAVMKIDFYSPHIYPPLSAVDGHDVPELFERYKVLLYWTAASSPMPWLIGETSFSAEDDDFDPLNDYDDLTNTIPCHLNNEPQYDQLPWRDGSEAQQAEFADVSMDAVHQYLGSGYSWWGFQNDRSHWLCEPVPPDPDDLYRFQRGYASNFWGLLKYGNDVTEVVGLNWTG